MWAAKPPLDTAGDSARACVDGIANEAVRKVVLQSLALFKANSETYQAAGVADSLHRTSLADYPLPPVLTSEKMHWLYSSRLARARTPSRPIYERLRAAGPDQRCAYCRSRVATTLDHFIPKTEIHTLSIEPWNLVPCCSDCNLALGSYWPGETSPPLIHPYFMPEVGRWLWAKVIHDIPTTVMFYADPTDEVSPQLSERIEKQFSLLNLGVQYSKMFAAELTTVLRAMRSYFNSEDAVQRHLRETAEIEFLTDTNALRGVFYEALADDDWFVANHPIGEDLRIAVAR